MSAVWQRELTRINSKRVMSLGSILGGEKKPDWWLAFHCCCKRLVLVGHSSSGVGFGRKGLESFIPFLNLVCQTWSRTCFRSFISIYTFIFHVGRKNSAGYFFGEEKTQHNTADQEIMSWSSRRRSASCVLQNIIIMKNSRLAICRIHEAAIVWTRKLFSSGNWYLGMRSRWIFQKTTSLKNGVSWLAS